MFQAKFHLLKLSKIIANFLQWPKATTTTPTTPTSIVHDDANEGARGGPRMNIGRPHSPNRSHFSTVFWCITFNVCCFDVSECLISFSVHFVLKQCWMIIDSPVSSTVSGNNMGLQCNASRHHEIKIWKKNYLFRERAPSPQHAFMTISLLLFIVILYISLFRPFISFLHILFHFR